MPQVVGSGRDFGRGPDCDWRLEGRSAPTSGRSQRATTTSASGVYQKFWYWDACRVLDGYPCCNVNIAIRISLEKNQWQWVTRMYRSLLTVVYL